MHEHSEYVNKGKYHSSVHLRKRRSMGRRRVTHATVWRNRPSEKNSFVSGEVHLSFPTLRKSNAKRVLDVACGNGLGVSIPLCAQGYDVHSFDKWKAAVNALEKNALHAGFKSRGKISDMYERFPYRTSFFDASFCFQAMYHGNLSQIESALQEIKRVTRKGGCFFGTFIPYAIKEEQGKHFFEYTKKNKTIGRIYVKVDKDDPLLCYNLKKNCEYLVPHYYFTRKKLRSTLEKFFSEVRIRKVPREEKRGDLFFVRCRV